MAHPKWLKIVFSFDALEESPPIRKDFIVATDRPLIPRIQ